MSIAVRSDGILETHVQWKDIEEKMQEALGTSATFGPEKTVQNIGAGNGFLSRISLIHPDWQNGSDDLPKAFIAKICCTLSMMDFSDKCDAMFDTSEVLDKMVTLCISVHNMEVDTYKLLHKYSDGRIPLPKIYGSNKFSDENKTKGFLIMEYFDDVIPCHVNDNIEIVAVKKALRSVAIWQSIGLKMTDEERSIFSTTFLADNFGDIFEAKMIDQLADGLHEFCGEEHKETIDKYHQLMLKLCNRAYYSKVDAIPDRLGSARVFCHGDLWSTNILWTINDGVHDIRSHIDFQTSTFNSPAMDLARFFSACLSGENRRKHHVELLETFYEYLLEETEGNAPYTLEELKTSFEYFVPLGSFFVVPVITPLYAFWKNEKPDLAATAKSNLLEKALSLMEDALESYSKHPLD